ncbi:hypothetical protein [Paraburkholderia sp. ZP32-5]|uniref:hypothetical protein n=1 Tax=Paraburkholderia sp. ZP32-5 TaxID=2883245 RepID=UPI001F3AB80F|nr:hypothetical protein [Paraburkholderia sp. ZP32-5]
MTTISSLNAGILPTASLTGAASVTPTSGNLSAEAIAESTVVTIPSPQVESPVVYTPEGTLAGVEPTVSWAQNNTDAVSRVMAGDYAAGTMSGQFYDLGSAVLDRFNTTDSNFSQSVTVGPVGGPDALKLSGLTPQGDIKLTVQTKSGATVGIELYSGDGTLSVNVKSSGPLSDADRSAVAKLADSFQQAIDGLTSSPPALNLNGLTQYDTSVLSSVQMQFNVTNDGFNDVSANIALNSSTRSIQLADSTGKINVSVDTSDSAIWGSSAQQNQAIASYLTQFDKADAQGHGSSALMSMFKDAFTQMNSNYGTSSQQLPGTTYSPWLAQSDHAMLTGLADFNASITDNPVSSNPYVPDQTDNFSYQVSQNTKTEGDLMNGKISQTQQAHLKASYHEPLAGNTLALTTSAASQNYQYVQVNADSSSTVNIATERNNIIQATLNRSSSQSTEVSQYEHAVLVSDVTTPTSTSESTDLLALLKPFLTNGQAEQDSAGWQQTLSAIHSAVLL